MEAKEHKSECGHFEASEKAGLLRQTYRAACEPNRAGDTHDTHLVSDCAVCEKNRHGGGRVAVSNQLFVFDVQCRRARHKDKQQFG